MVGNRKIIWCCLLKCLFVSDLHGVARHFTKLFDLVKEKKPDGFFIGGDILPNQFKIRESVDNFLKEELFLKIKKVTSETRFFVILGNDDPRVFEELFIDADENGLLNYVHNRTVDFGDLFVSGYSFVPPTPFQLKDWEKYDVSRFVDVGAVSPEEGIRTVDVKNDAKRYDTISEDLKALSKNAPVDKTIFLFHSPPYKTHLDRVAVDGKMVDNAPLDVHVGSIAIRRFIEKKHPLLTLHGHIHESVGLTGDWREKFPKTFSFSAAHDGPELAVVSFNTDCLEKASRELF